MRNFNFEKASLQTLWVEAKDGQTYICRASDIKDKNNVTEEELKNCVVEGENPQND